MGTDVKLVCFMPFNGVDTLRALASTSNLYAAAQALTSPVFAGKQFLFFASLPAGHPAFADFDLFPDWAGKGNVATTSQADNLAMINAMLALEADPNADPKPSDALTW